MPAKKLYTDEELRAHKNSRTAQRYIENRDSIRAYHAARHQANKSDPSYMEKLREKSRLFGLRNPERVKEIAKESKARHAEKRKQEVRDWFAANPDKRAAYEQNRRAKKKANGGVVSPNIKKKLFELQSGHCACCKKKFSMPLLHIDHIYPLAKGGEHSDANLQLLCQPCNQSKYAKHPIDYMQEKGFLL